MADNVLGTLFGDIANAIRTKTGDTATMKPNEFPTKIAGIEVGGGGGGDLPAGIYLKYIAKKPKKGVGRPFVFNDCIHILTKTDGNKELLVYKLENNAFTQVASTATSTSLSLSDFSIAVLNGKVHFICNLLHYVWDGTTITQKSNISVVSSTAYSYACSHNGELYVTQQYVHNIYVWDESTDTWSIKIANVGNGTFTQSDVGEIYSHGGVLYYAKGSSSKGVYRIVGDTPNVELVSDVATMTRDHVITDSGIYRYWSSYGLYRDGVTIGSMYTLGTYAYLLEHNGNLYIDGGSKDYYAFQQICIVEETG